MFGLAPLHVLQPAGLIWLLMLELMMMTREHFPQGRAKKHVFSNSGEENEMEGSYNLDKGPDGTVALKIH